MNSDPTSFQRIRELFDRAADLTGEERESVLRQAEKSHPGEVARVRNLLLADDLDEGILAVPWVHQDTPIVGTRIDAYILESRLGEGGMGEVWLANQLEPVKRKVAIKMIKPGMDTRQVIARFNSERQILARLSHPCIAQVFDAGITEQGRPYFVMEYIDGVSIDTFCEEQQLEPNDRLRLIQRVCEGVQHAHDKAVLHRDLKPSNILITADGDRWMPKIIDFGISKALTPEAGGKFTLTEFGKPVGTPEYMSPEQCEHGAHDVDTRTDVYALGVVLYRLLTGRLPGGPETGVARPSQFVRELSGDLDWIVLKALADEPDHRYPSPRDLSLDIDRFLESRPVIARAPTLGYLAARYFRRHRFGVSVAALLAVVTISGFMATSMSLKRALEAESLAVQEAVTAEQALNFLVGLFHAGDPEEGLGAAANPLEMVELGAQRLEDSEFSDPLVKARLGQVIGEVYLQLGEHLPARALLLETLESQWELLGPEHASTLRTRELLAFSYWAFGPLMHAEAHQRAVWLARTHQLGVNHESTLAAGRFLAEIQERSGRLDEAEALSREIKSRAESALGPQHPVTLATAGTLAEILYNRGELASAEIEIRAVIEAQTSVHGPDHLATAESELTLAAVLIRRGMAFQAEAILDRIMTQARRRFGEDHKAVYRLQAAYGDLRLSQGRPDEALGYYKDSLGGFQRLLDPEHPDVAGANAKVAQAQKMIDRRPSLTP